MRKQNTKQLKSWLLTTAGTNRKTPAPVSALKIAILFFISCVFISSHAASAWWFNESDQEILQKALKSDNPRTVEKCLDKFIKKQNYSAILQIKFHARTMLLAERRKMNSENRLNPTNVKKHLAPWVRIEQKANQFFKKITTQQQGISP
jgi:hypothetical protein